VRDEARAQPLTVFSRASGPLSLPQPTARRCSVCAQRTGRAWRAQSWKRPRGFRASAPSSWRALLGSSFASPLASLFQIAFGFAARSLCRCAFFWRRQFHPGPTGLRQANRNRLPGRSRAMFTLADMFHFLADKFTCLRRRRFTFPFIFTSAFDRFFFWHNTLFSLIDRDTVG
jgi:hypothetical protein